MKTILQCHYPISPLKFIQRKNTFKILFPKKYFKNTIPYLNIYFLSHRLFSVSKDVAHRGYRGAISARVGFVDFACA